MKNIHVDLPFLYEYQVSGGSHQSEYGVRGGRWVECGGTTPLTELPLINRGCASPTGPSGVFSTSSPGRDLDARQGPGSKASDPLGQYLPPPHLRQ